MSSSGADAEEADEVCANCGKAAVDEVKLKICTACKLVKYCSVECQKNHRPQHKKACKKRMAEIRDGKLFTKPDESHLGECPICCLPHSLDENKSGAYTCCGKRVCNGCAYANITREMEQGLEQRCPYCREPMPFTKEEAEKGIMKRAKANDPIALNQVGNKCECEGDYEGSFQYYTKAAELGDMNAHFNLSLLYDKGHGVEKDMKKKVYHLEEAAIDGHADARWNLGNHEGRNGRYDRAVKHWIIAAKLGFDRGFQKVKDGYALGLVSEEDYESALRGHQAAVDATKSQQREEACKVEFHRRNAEKYYN